MRRYSTRSAAVTGKNPLRPAANEAIRAGSGRTRDGHAVNTIVDALILGIIEGVTEFIPVSSTAHLLLAGRLLGFDKRRQGVRGADPARRDPRAALGLFRPAVAARRRRCRATGRPGASPRRRHRVPAGGGPRRRSSTISSRRCCSTRSPLICVMLIVGGIVLLFIDRCRMQPRYTDDHGLSARLCLGIGLFQCLSLIPGVSRSGATIVGALLLGSRQALGGGVLLLPRHADDARRLRLRSLQEHRRASDADTARR